MPSNSHLLGAFSPLNGSNSDIESRGKQRNSDITAHHEKYIPTYNSLQGNHGVKNSNGGICNSSFVASNSQLDKAYSRPNSVHPNNDILSSKSDHNDNRKRWNPFNRFQQTLAINE